MTKADAKTRSCTHVEGCSLFPKISQPGFLRVWQINYCQADFEKCERFKLALEGKHVPDTMLPNGQNLAALAKK